MVLAYWWGPLGIWFFCQSCLCLAWIFGNSLEEVRQCWSCRSKLPHSITYIMFSLAETCHVNNEVKAKRRQTNQLHPGLFLVKRWVALGGIWTNVTLQSRWALNQLSYTRTPQLVQYFQATSFKPQYFQLIIMKISWSPLQKQPCMHMLLRVLQCVIRSDGHFWYLVFFVHLDVCMLSGCGLSISVVKRSNA